MIKVIETIVGLGILSLVFSGMWKAARENDPTGEMANVMFGIVILAVMVIVGTAMVVNGLGCSLR